MMTSKVASFAAAAMLAAQSAMAACKVRGKCVSFVTVMTLSGAN